MMMESEVANPFLRTVRQVHQDRDITYMMLSLYRMTIAVIRPPSVCVKTVPNAHPLKLLKLAITLPNHPSPSAPEGMNKIGTKAGTRENSESCVFRTQRSGGGVEPDEAFSMNSKYTPASPEVRHAKVTATNPRKGRIIR